MFLSDRAKIFGSPIFSSLWFLLFSIVRIVIELRLQEPFLEAEISTVAHFLSFYLLCYVVTAIIIFYGRNQGLYDALAWANVAFIILPFPPLIDYVLYVEPQIYSYAPQEHFLGNLLTVFSVYGDASWGQRILGVYVSVIIGLAVFLSHKRIIRALKASLANYLYTAVVSVEWIRPLLPSGSMNVPEAIYFSDSVINQGFTIYYVLIAHILLFTIWLASHKKALPSLIASLRPVRSVHWVLVGWLGIALSPNPLPWELVISHLIVITFSCLLGWWFIALVNDYNDIAIDKLSNPNRLFVHMPQLINERETWFCWLAITSTLTALSLGFVPFILMLCYLIGGIVYSVPPPLKLPKPRRYTISSSSIGAGSALFYLMGSIAYIPLDGIAFNDINWYVLFALTLGFGMAGYIKDEKDAFADKQAGIATLFTKLPYKQARKITGLLLLGGWCILLTISLNNLYTFIVGCVCAIVAISSYSKQNNPLIQISLFQVFLASMIISGLLNKEIIHDYIIW